MLLSSMIDLVMDNLIIAGVALLVILFIIFRLFKTARMYLGAKSFVKKAAKQRRKKFNGIDLVEKIKKKRKKGTNAFNKLNGRAKKMVKKFLGFKMSELPVVTRFSYGKLLKRSKDKLIIFVRNDRKIIKKITLKRGQKQIIDVMNKYQCVDEMIHFLHNLPDAILEQQDYDIYINQEDVSIGYIIK